ncbi:hypothetical protein LOTGIDRAFT_175769 [Lottia gigantea]|uniref:Uncharacterized protein n=1 Tax=Lottia gigantea TaxID=225164 RepID=V3ZJT1_LOTGI|nr:hypothetical protein LOTGIDRAFT_175769 [Lottia gigantea]ESO91543.1 hypothetical protein LOTGIDRAFT_175769 [Lottia gigantea]
MAEIPINSSEKNVTIDGEFDLSSILFDKKLSSTSKSIKKGQEKRKRTANKAVKELNHTQTSTSCPDPNSKMDSSTSTSIDDTTVVLAETNSKLDSNTKDNETVSMGLFKSEMLKIRTELKDIIIDSIHDSRKVERTRPREVNIDEYYASTSADQHTHGHGVKRKHITDPVNSVIHDLSSSDDDIQFTQNRYKIPKLSHLYKEDGSVNSDNVICQIDELLQDKQTSDKDSDFEESLEQEYN